MSEKTQALINALNGVGISTTCFKNSNGDIQIEIACEPSFKENTHFLWSLGENKSFSFVIGNNEQVKEITE